MKKKLAILALLTYTVVVACVLISIGQNHPNFKARGLSNGNVVEAIICPCRQKGDTVSLKVNDKGFYNERKDGEQYVLLEQIPKK